MTRLSVNVNKVATLRNTRPQLDIPSVLKAGRICLEAGASGLTVHPRPDQRHIRPADVDALAELWRQYPGREFNIEGNPFEGDYMAICQRVRPTQCTLVPDDPAAKTSDHGWDVSAERQRLAPVIAQLKAAGCRVSLFMEADAGQMRVAREVGADRVELYTEPYAAGFARGELSAAEGFVAAAKAAGETGLGVNAGHDLNLDNLPGFLSKVPNVLEVSIGHALIANALEFGLAQTVRKYLDACANRPAQDA